MTTTRIDLPVRGMTCASCVARIEKGLADVPGIHAASVNLAAERATLTYDPARVGVDELIRAIQEVGYDVPAEKLTLSIGGMSCASCVATIEQALSAVPGVVRASVNLERFADYYKG
jgi:Cu+-exporting ATPase